VSDCVFKNYFYNAPPTFLSEDKQVIFWIILSLPLVPHHVSKMPGFFSGESFSGVSVQRMLPEDVVIVYKFI